MIDLKLEKESGIYKAEDGTEYPYTNVYVQVYDSDGKVFRVKVPFTKAQKYILKDYLNTDF